MSKEALTWEDLLDEYIKLKHPDGVRPGRPSFRQLWHWATETTEGQAMFRVDDNDELLYRNDPDLEFYNEGDFLTEEW